MNSKRNRASATGAAKDEEAEFRTHIGFLIHDVSRKRRNYFDRTLRPLGLTRSQLVLLLQLQNLPQDEGISQRRLAQEMHIGQVSLGELVALLESQGAVERKVAAHDRRQRNLFLTDRGRELIARSRELIDAMNAELLAGIPRDRVDSAEETLALMQQNLARLGC
ncbi:MULTISPECIES: MarR family winged helix-turn-helix transcriptional regulator [Sphingobium]|uniref:MarR family winged helix-turn-helix transcriptional regulator n=1 Tax=Sphingobium sp. MI1205 TaxID=407020 RepID=UPI0007703BEC|nr:MarR family transcriptional regulator [Sphingobium sp. MI1205]AMK19816.1 putative MarR family transcriptional regulator [Sphingobium sp. MI1205]